MDDLSADLAALGESIADVLTSESESRKVHAFIDGKNDLDAAIWRQATELGWLAVGLPEDVGGLGMGVQGLAVLHRELGRRVTPGAFISTLSAAQTLVDCADKSVQEKYLPLVASGKLSIGIPSASLQAGPGSLVVSGGKVSGKMTEVLSAANAGLVLVPVKNGAGEAWALIEIDGKAARLTAHTLWDQTRSFCTLECTGAAVAHLVADAKQAAAWRARLGVHQSLAVIADSMGGAESILNLTLDYMKQRVQFERPIASFQALKHRAARLKIESELARHVAAQALQSVAANDADCAAWASMSKVTVSDAYCLIAADCVQLHGGVGHTWEFDCHISLKRSRLNQSMVENNAQQLDRVAGAFAAATSEGRSVLELPI